MMKHCIFFFSAILALSACDSATGSGEFVDIPTFRIDCDTAKCKTAPAATDAYVVLARSGCSSTTIEFEPIAATGFVSATCNGATGCTGTVTSWTDASENPISSIESRNYSICGWVDIDDNGIKNSLNDAFSEDSQTVSSSTIILSDWSVTYSSRKKIHPHR